MYLTPFFSYTTSDPVVDCHNNYEGLAMCASYNFASNRFPCGIPHLHHQIQSRHFSW